MFDDVMAYLWQEMPNTCTCVRACVCTTKLRQPAPSSLARARGMRYHPLQAALQACLPLPCAPLALDGRRNLALDSLGMLALQFERGSIL
jgi:hypothetical protein